MESIEKSGVDAALPTKELGTLNALAHVLEHLRANKPQDRSEQARHWAVTITELEKVVAYFRVYVWGGDG